MFGLFKNETPEAKLERLIIEDLEEEIKIALKEVKGNDFLAGFVIEGAAGYVYKSYMENAALMAISHDMTKEKIESIIKNATNKIRIKYLDNPTLIP